MLSRAAGPGIGGPNVSGTSWMPPTSAAESFSAPVAPRRLSRPVEGPYVNLAAQLMQLRQRPGDSKAIGLCGVQYGSGASTAAQHLALALAAGTISGRVLLVDVSGSAKRGTRIQGWAELLSGDAELSDVIVPTSEPQVSRLYFVQDPGAASLPMDAVRIRELLQSLKERFEWIVFDLPSEARADGLPVASVLDGVMLVLQAHRTQSSRARQVKQALEQSGAHLVGVVLTRTRSFVPRFLRRWFPRSRVV